MHPFGVKRSSVPGEKTQLSRGSLKAKDRRSLWNNEGEEVKKQTHQNHIETIYFIVSPTFPELVSREAPHWERELWALACTPALREGESQVDTGLFRLGISNENIRRRAEREGNKTKLENTDSEVCNKD